MNIVPDPDKVTRKVAKSGVKKTTGECLIAGLICAAVGGGICFVIKGVMSHYKKKEQNNVSANKRKETKTASSCRMEENEALHTHRIDEMHEQTLQKKEVINAKKEADIERIEKRAQLRKERDAAKANPISANINLGDRIENYHEAVQNGTVDGSKERILGFPWLREGYDTGFAGPTDCGKSTFIMQVAIALAKGRCDVKLSPEWHDISPMSVVMFSLEQSNSEIGTYYGSVINDLSTLNLYAGSQIAPAQIITIVEENMRKAGESGIVVIIDNYTKLASQADSKEMRWFYVKLEQLRMEGLKAAKPLTLLKVYHAKSDWKLSTPLTPSNVKGDKKNVDFTNNFLYFTYCKLGPDKRVLGFMKLKHGSKETISILEYADTEINQFRYVGEGSKKDLGESQMEGGGVDNKQGPGRKSEYSFEDIKLLYDMVQSGECTYKEVEEAYGISKSAIKKRIQRSKK